MNPTLRQSRAPIRPGVIATALGVLATLGLLLSQAPSRPSIYLADSPPVQPATAHVAHPTTPVAPRAALVAFLRALR